MQELKLKCPFHYITATWFGQGWGDPPDPRLFKFSIREKWYKRKRWKLWRLLNPILSLTCWHTEGNRAMQYYIHFLTFFFFFFSFFLCTLRTTHSWDVYLCKTLSLRLFRHYAIILILQNYFLWPIFNWTLILKSAPVVTVPWQSFWPMV